MITVSSREDSAPQICNSFLFFKELNVHEGNAQGYWSWALFWQKVLTHSSIPKLIGFPPVQCEASLWCLQHAPDPLQQGWHFKVILPDLKPRYLQGACRTGNANKICMLATCSSLNLSKHFTSSSMQWLPLSVCKSAVCECKWCYVCANKCCIEVKISAVAAFHLFLGMK